MKVAAHFYSFNVKRAVCEWPNYGLSTALLQNSLLQETTAQKKTRRLKILQCVCTSYYIYWHTKQRPSFLNHKNKVNKHANHGTARHKTMSSDEIFKKSSNKKCTLFMFYAWRNLLCSNPWSQHENTDRLTKAVGTIARVNVCEITWLMTVHLSKKKKNWSKTEFWYVALMCVPGKIITSALSWKHLKHCLWLRQYYCSWY